MPRDPDSGHIRQMVLDSLPNWRLYAATPLMKTGFEWLETTDLDSLSDGRIEIVPDELAAIIQTNATKSVESARLEAHRRFIDIQYVIDGAEAMGRRPLEGLEPAGDFDEDADIGFYLGEPVLFEVAGGEFAIFYPHDAHMPCIHPRTGPAKARKVVLKVAAR